MRVGFGGWAAAAFVIFVWGITFVNTRALLGDFSALEIQVLRFGLAWAVLVAAGVCKRHAARRCGYDDGMAGGSHLQGLGGLRDEGLFAAMGFCGVFCYQFLENCAIYYTNASNVAILVSFGPVVTALMMRWFRRGAQPAICKLWVGSAVAIAGVALISFNNAVVFELRPLGDMMALAAMVSWGVYSVLIDRANRKGVPQIVVIRKTFGWALVFMLPLAVWGATDSGYVALDGSFSITLDSAANLTRFVEPMNWVNFVFLGIFASALCFVLWNVACRSLGVVKTTVGLYFTPIVGVIFAAIFLGERMTMTSIVGGVLIIFGVAIANWSSHRGSAGVRTLPRGGEE